MEQAEFKIAALLDEHRNITGLPLSIGTIESATGGKIADKLTDVPGISLYLKGSLVSYSTGPSSA